MKNRINLKITSFMIAMAFATLPLFAQPGQGQGRGQGQGQDQGQGQRRQMTEEDVKERVNRMATSLECSEEQEKKLLDFEMGNYRQMQKDREKFAGDRDAMRAYMMEQNKIREKKYGEILTEEQMKKYTKMMEERRQQRQGQGGQGQGEGSSGSRGRGRN